MPSKSRDTQQVNGLEQKEAERLLAEFGPNEIRELFRVSSLHILLRQIENNFIVYLLSAAAMISFVIEDTITGYAIVAILVVIIAAGFMQEYRAEKALKALKKLVTPISIVVRDGKEREIPSVNLVPGDVVSLRVGEKVPADCVVLDATELRINDSMLTGESKEKSKVPAHDLKNYKPENTLFMGTFVVNGLCTAKVMHTGMNTEFGKIAGMISTAKKESPLQGKVNRITKYVVIIAIVASLLAGLLLLLRAASISEDTLLQVFIVVIALSVSAFPEGFPVVLITTLASGAYRMAKKNVIVNKMSILETLGETTVICSDKTGTITKGEMSAKKVFANNQLFDISGAGYELSGEFSLDGTLFKPELNPTLSVILKAAVICNDAKIEINEKGDEYVAKGSRTESALLVMAAKANLFKESFKSDKIAEVPFSSQRKLMSVLSKEPAGNYVYVKGAPEILISNCRYIYLDGNITELKSEYLSKMTAANHELTTASFRTLAFAFKKVEEGEDLSEHDLVLLGFVGLVDPPREEVPEALRICKSAGIGVKMITGDDKNTALAVAKQIGLSGNVIEGPQLDKITDDEFAKTVGGISIFERVTPEHKLRIVKALKASNEIVAMTGDGVNDAPALKEAHIGIAMGKNGTDVSRESADLILKDDNFFTIVSAISEGRTTFSNIRKFFTYQLSCNYAEILVILLGLLVGFPIPLLALQILFMNLVTDDMPALTLGFNPPSHDVMKVKPRKGSDLLNKGLMSLLVITGTVMAVGTLSVFYIVSNVMHEGIDVARATTMVTLILFEIFNAFNFRSFRFGVYQSAIMSNKYLVYASAASIAATAFVIYGPLSSIFGVVPLPAEYWVIALGAALSVVVAYDIIRVVSMRKGWSVVNND